MKLLFFRRCQDLVMSEINSAGEDVLVFYNDKASFNAFAQIQQENESSMMRYSVGNGINGNSSGSTFNSSLSCSDLDDDPDDGNCILRYHIELVRLLACCTMGKNVYTEIKCNSLLPLDDIVKMVCHRHTIPAVSIVQISYYIFANIKITERILFNLIYNKIQVKDAYVNFLTHCYIDTEVEMKEIYTSSHMWQLFEQSFIQDMDIVSSSSPTNPALEHYVSNTLMDIITTFFKSPFSDQSTTVQVGFHFI